MKLEEAIEKYGIKVPSDAEFYSEDYKLYFEEKKRTQDLIDRFSMYEEFHNMYVKSFYITFHKAQRDLQKDRKSIANSEAVILGGQAGAGKGRISYSCKKRISKTRKRNLFNR